jgi:hypothetical protein
MPLATIFTFGCHILGIGMATPIIGEGLLAGQSLRRIT